MDHMIPWELTYVHEWAGLFLVHGVGGRDRFQFHPGKNKPTGLVRLQDPERHRHRAAHGHPQALTLNPKP